MLSRVLKRPASSVAWRAGLSTLAEKPVSASAHILTCPGQALPPGTKLLETFEPLMSQVRPLLEALDHTMGDSRFHTYLCNPPTPTYFASTARAQPAILATGVIIAEIMQRHFGVDLMRHVEVTLGHSLGEFTALAVGENSRAGVSKEEALALMVGVVKARGILMEQAVAMARSEGQTFTMIAIIAGGKTPEASLLQVQAFFGARDMLANINSHRQVVVSGETTTLNAAVEAFRVLVGADWKAMRLSFKPLPTDIPFHSPYLRGMEPEMAALLEASGPQAERLVKPMIANVNGCVINSMAEARVALVDATSRTVRFTQCINQNVASTDEDTTVFVNLGPGTILSGLVDRTMTGSYVNHNLNTLEGVETYVQCLRDTGRI